MPKNAVTPTRMVLNQLKGRLKTATRGHKLLKDKRDELMRQFMDVVRRNKELRQRVEDGLTEAFGALTVAGAVMSPEALNQALMYPRQSVDLGMGFKSVMSVNVPSYEFRTKNADPGEIYPYGFTQTSGELDLAMESLSRVFGDMLELGEKSPELHSDVGRYLSEKGIDMLLTYGPLSKNTASAVTNGKTECYSFDEKDALTQKLLSVLEKGDVVLFKASRGMKLEEVIHSVYDRWGK